MFKSFILLIVFFIPLQLFPNTKKVPYVVLISIDGFRHDYGENFNLDFLKKISLDKKIGLKPVYPSKTFPNHLSLVTGKYPDEHGIIGNFFYSKQKGKMYAINDEGSKRDPTWYKADPIWVTLEKKNIKTASFFWPGSDVAINDTYPTYYKLWNKKVTNDIRLEQVLTWLKLKENKRPHFISLYLSEVDHTGHKYGPNSIETKKACKKVDALLKKFFNDLQNLDIEVNVILCSDHGMAEIKAQNLIYLSDYFETQKSDKIFGQGSLVHLYIKRSEKVEKLYTTIRQNNDDKFLVYRKGEIPSKYNLNKSNDTGDLVIITKYPNYFLKDRNDTLRIKGDHGYDARNVLEMHGIYIPVGPYFEKNDTNPTETKDIFSIIKNIYKDSF